jgi:hypothetical protein
MHAALRSLMTSGQQTYVSLCMFPQLILTFITAITMVKVWFWDLISIFGEFLNCKSLVLDGGGRIQIPK